MLALFNGMELDEDMLMKDAEDVVEFDHLLAMKYW